MNGGESVYFKWLPTSNSTMTKPIREWILSCAANPGREWRVLAHLDGREVSLANQGEFDEVVLDHWFHLERMDERAWWMRIGDARVQATVHEDGRVSVSVDRGFYESIDEPKDESADPGDRGSE